MIRRSSAALAVASGPAAVALALLLALPGSSPAQTPAAGQLRVTVQDQTGAVIVGAMVEVLADPSDTEPLAARATDATGVATFEGLATGRYVVLAWFEGFEPASLPEVRVRAGQVRRETLVLHIAGLAELVDVGRDRRESATDPRGDAFSTVLDEQDVDDLPDDPDELQAALEQAAGPGAVIRVNGFRGGGLPPKSQIREIRFRRNAFAAENHESGFVHVDILTRPGTEEWRGSATVSLRDDSMNARNAMAPRKVDEQQRRGGFSLDGPLWKGHTSLSLSVDGVTAWDTQTILAAGPQGSLNGAFRRPTDRVSFGARVEHALSKAHVLRGEYQQRGTENKRLGVGDLDLPERAYQRSTTDRLVRLGTNGPLSKKVFNEVRLQLRWQDNESLPFSTDPTVRVSGAFTSGGANTQGARAQRDVELAQNVDVALARHAIRVGLLVEGSHLDSSSIRNANGTFTFGSLDDFEAGRPTTYTQRQGDPRVAYAMWQFAWYVQDDIRARKDLTLSLGLRHEWQTHLDDVWNLAPRAGVAWAPFEGGRTTFRGGAGVFFDWYDADTYEQTLQVDGERLTDLVVRSPGYPDPLAGGAAAVQPPGVIRQEPGMSLPVIRQASVGVEQALGDRSRVNVSYLFRDGRQQLRSVATNLPGANGQRPEPAYGNITVIDSFGRERLQSLTLGLNHRLDWHRLFVASNYTLGRSRDDGDGPLSLPADSTRPDEWGPSRDDIRHRLGLFGNMDLWWNFRLGVTLRADSATPYNVTTGFDDNGDTVFTDRPAGLGRNSARGDGAINLDLRLSWRVGFGERRRGRGGPSGPGGGPVVVMRRGGEGEGGGPMGMGGGPGDRRVSLEFYAQAFNVTNETNLANYNGVVSSPLFGQPNAARPPRRLEVGTRLVF